VEYPLSFVLPELVEKCLTEDIIEPPHIPRLLSHEQ